MVEQTEGFLVCRAGESWGWLRSAIPVFSSLPSSAQAQNAIKLANESPCEVFLIISPSKERELALCCFLDRTELERLKSSIPRPLPQILSSPLSKLLLMPHSPINWRNGWPLKRKNSICGKDRWEQQNRENTEETWIGNGEQKWPVGMSWLDSWG